MGKLLVEINDKLDKEFRKLLITKYGSKKGILSKVVEKAICEWVEANK